MIDGQWYRDRKERREKRKKREKRERREGEEGEERSEMREKREGGRGRQGQPVTSTRVRYVFIDTLDNCQVDWLGKIMNEEGEALGTKTFFSSR
jgi:hypothetical protein